MKRYKWTVEIEIDPVWVADGFDLDEERLADILQHALPYAYSYEVGGKVLKAPDPRQVRCEQGYNEPGYQPWGPES